EVIAQLKFRIFQESCKFPPQPERVLAGFAECAGGQCNGLCCLDLATDILQERLGSFLTQSMTPSETNYSAASFGVDGKQLVHARHNRSCKRVSWIQLHCFKKLSSSMSPTRGVNHSRTADLIVCGVAVGLQNAFKLSQEPPRSIASTA